MSNPFLLSGLAAQWNDRLIIYGAESIYRQPIKLVGTCFISLVVFPIFAAFDFVVWESKAIKHKIWTVFSNNPSYNARMQKEINKCRDIAQRCLLGVVCSPVSLFSADLVTQHFVPKMTRPRELAPYGKLYSSIVKQKTPRTIRGVRRIIKDAYQNGKKIAIAGACMSQGKQVLPPGENNIVIHVKEFNKIQIDPKSKVAKVGAGATWGHLQAAANQEGLAVQVMQASNIFSIGGSLSVNCHGWDHQAGTLANTIQSLTIMDAKGRVHKNLTPEHPLFKCAVGGYGGFGVILEAEIKLTDNLLLEERGEEVAPENYVDYFNHHVINNDQIAMHLYRLSLDPNHLLQTGVAVSYHKKGTEGQVAQLVDEPERGNRLDRIELHLVRRFGWLRKVAWDIEKKNALTPKQSTRNEIMRPPINPIFNHSGVDAEWLQEYFVKEEDLADFLKFLGGVLQENGVPVFNASVRYVKQDDKAELAYAKNGNRFAIVLFFNQSLRANDIEKTKKWVQKVIDYLGERGGTYYLPYQHFATQEQFAKCYPNWQEIAAKKKSMDPKGIFSNGIYEDYIAPPTQSIEQSAK